MEVMKKIAVEDLKPGMSFTKSVYADNNNVLVGAHIPVKEEDIKKLMKWGVATVETAGELVSDKTGAQGDSNSPVPRKTSQEIVADYENLLKKRSRLIEIHGRAMRAVAEAHEYIRKDKQFNNEPLKKSAGEIVALLKDNYNVFLFLYGLDDDKDSLVAHPVNVAFYSVILGIGLKYEIDKLKSLALAALLTNAGMMKIPVYILHKQSDLSEQERNQIKTHPLLGYKVIMDLGSFGEEIANVSLQHHEQFDGKGYPRGLKGDEIDEFARIVAIADSYEAQISKRSYREKIDFYHAMKNLLSSGVNRFDPILLRLFLSVMSVYPIGSLVELNDGSVGVVIGSVPEKPLRPILKVVFEPGKVRSEKTRVINLLDELSFYIVRVLGEKELGVNLFDVL